MAELGRYQKAHAVDCIRDNYTPPMAWQDSEERRIAAFDLAKKQYIDALKESIAVAEAITMRDVFPKACQ